MKKQIDFIANATSESNDLIKIISNIYCVNHIYTGSSIPVLRNNDTFIVGANQIRYHCSNLDIKTIRKKKINKINVL